MATKYDALTFIPGDFVFQLDADLTIKKRTVNTESLSEDSVFSVLGSLAWFTQQNGVSLSPGVQPVFATAVKCRAAIEAEA